MVMFAGVDENPVLPSRGELASGSASATHFTRP